MLETFVQIVCYKTNRDESMGRSLMSEIENSLYKIKVILESIVGLGIWTEITGRSYIDAH